MDIIMCKSSSEPLGDILKLQGPVYKSFDFFSLPEILMANLS
jgi:hypothetical protein